MLRKISFTGDIMCKREVLNQYRKENTFDFAELFEPVRSILSESDYVIGNLETPIAGQETGGFTEQSYNFNSPIEFAQAVKATGVDYVSTANNHCLDRGIEGISATNLNLDRIGLKHSGTNNDPNAPKGIMVSVGNLKMGILSYTCTTEVAANKIRLSKADLYRVNLAQEQALNSKLTRWLYYNRFSELRRMYRILAILTGQKNKGNPDDRRENSFRCKREIKREIKKLKKQGADFIVMNLHAGGQYNLQPETRVVNYVKWLHRQNVSAVVVNHEHLVQKSDFSELEAKKRFVTYCLGNFLGGAGVYYPPYDKMVEYSVLLHLYVEEETLQMSCTFTILKMIHLTEHRYQVVPLYDLIHAAKDETERKKLIEDNLDIYNRFLNRNVKQLEVQLEYPCTTE